MVVKNNFDFSKEVVKKSVDGVLGKINDAVSKQKYLLPRQVSAFNKSLIPFGMMVSFDGNVFALAQDFVGAKATKDMDVKSEDTLNHATAFYMTAQRLLLDRVLKPSLKGSELIGGSLMTVSRALPKTKGGYFADMASAAYAFMVNTDEISNLYMYGNPSPKTFKALHPEAYDVATRQTKALEGKSM